MPRIFAAATPLCVLHRTYTMELTAGNGRMVGNGQLSHGRMIT
jgi:hypothetical protein